MQPVQFYIYAQNINHSEVQADRLLYSLCLGHRGLLVVYVFVFAPSIKLSPSGSPCARYKWGTGSKLVTRSGVFEIPVVE